MKLHDLKLQDLILTDDNRFNIDRKVQDFQPYRL